MHDSLPFFSIIIPTYNRPRALSACLLAIAELDYPHDRFEVIVVHDAMGPTIEHATRQAIGQKLQLRELNQSHAGPAAARNLGAKHARGQYLAFTDDDCMVSGQWLGALAEHLTSAPGSACAGQIANYHDRNRYSQASQMINDFVVSINTSMKSPFVTSNNMVVPRAEFLELGGFDTRFPGAAGEDREFCVRWTESGLQLDHVSNAVVYHAHDLSLRSFWRQQFGYGRAAFLLRLIQKQKPKSNDSGLERPSFYLDLLRYPLKTGINGRNLHLALLLVLSQIAITAGFICQVLGSQRPAPRMSEGRV